MCVCVCGGGGGGEHTDTYIYVPSVIFNSRTSKMLDFVIPDENVAEILNTVDDELLLENMFSYKTLVDLNVPLERAMV